MYACEQLTSMCTSTHMEVKAHTEGLDVLFMLFQLLRAERLPAGSVWSHRDAIHLSEEGRSHWDRAAPVLTALRHPLTLLSLSHCHYLPLSISRSLLFPSLSPLFLNFFHGLFSCVCFGNNHLLYNEQFCCKHSIWMSFAILECKSKGIKVLKSVL